ncbi:hypothetical protein F5878DRAFT_549150 [Lentinula raphanica]|uniref:Core-binding (CB) domain-containing protein n=1 Tax=Lentinula raphanica TaxID=153919 RepID=A0AA38NW64_9AGAR|nr:hypothetical protein F5878DRAFT_549150 [Lentinula raphanica]
MTPRASRTRQPARRPWSREELVRGRNIALGLATDLSSQNSYNSHLNSYIAFCSNHSFPLDPTPDTLSFFVVYMSYHIEPRSVGTYLSGICDRLEPYFPDVRQNRNSTIVRKTLTGMKKLRSKPVRRKQPLTRKHLLDVTSPLSDSSPYDECLFGVLLVTGTCGLLRLGELTIPDNANIRNFRKVTSRASLEFINDNGFAFWLPYHKADRLFEGNRIDGASPQAIQAAGRWASDTFQIYIRKNPFVLNAMLAARRS